MNNELVTQDKLIYTNDQIALIRSQIAPQAKDEELKLFLYQCQRTGLDALSRQIYCIHRGGKMTIQTSIDGFRVIAERSGDYGGQSEPVFQYNESGKLISCKISCFKFRGEQRYEASVGVAYWSEYVQEYNGKAGGLWGKMPHTMLSKVAEALALRKAFPQDLSGLYTGDEMEQASEPVTVVLPEKKVDNEAFIAEIEKCETEEELLNLWQTNKVTDKHLINLFKTKKTQIRDGITA